MSKEASPTEKKQQIINTKTRKYWKYFTSAFFDERITSSSSFTITEPKDLTPGGDLPLIVSVKGSKFDFNPTIIKDIPIYFPKKTWIRVNRDITFEGVTHTEIIKIYIVIPKNGAVAFFGDNGIYIKTVMGILKLLLIGFFIWIHYATGVVTY